MDEFRESEQTPVSRVRGSTWELARPALPSRLRPFVRSWIGYAERAPGLARHRELPGSAIVVIFEFGPPIRVSASGGEVCFERGPGGFVAGLDDRSSLTEHDGEQAGIQVDLSPLGARAVFGVPLRELSRRVVGLPELSIGARGLSERLAEARSWTERFAMVERLLCDRIAAAKSGSPQVAWALAQIDETGGRLRIDELAAAIGYSRKHLVALFHEHVGLAPKRYAGLVRFNRLVDRLADPAIATLDWSRLAVELGFADQPHLVREVRRFAGVPPTELLRLLGRRVR